MRYKRKRGAAEAAKAIFIVLLYIYLVLLCFHTDAILRFRPDIGAVKALIFAIPSVFTNTLAFLPVSMLMLVNVFIMTVLFVAAVLTASAYRLSLED